MKKNYSSQRAGFTLVEAMVAISILSLSITGPLVIAQKGIASSVYSRDQITASYLAQEAVEYIRNGRDTNVIAGDDWLSGFETCMSTTNPAGCRIDARYLDFKDATGLAVTSCLSTCPRMYRNTPSGLYGYLTSSGWVQTPFTRTVLITPVGSDDREAIVSVKVSWSTTLFSPVKEFSVRSSLFKL